MNIQCLLAAIPVSLALLAGPVAGELPLLDSEQKRETITLATYPSLNPDGSRTAFAWKGDIWIGKAKGRATRLTFDSAAENGPVFSPDGKRIAFTSRRKGSDQVFIMPTKGGIPTQVTFHSEGSRVLGWYPDGKSILITGNRDFGTRSTMRFYRISLEKRSAEKLLFDAEGLDASLSPDGRKLLFTREGYDLYRQGYRGTKSSQIWLAENLESPNPKFTRIIARETGARSPKWKPDASGFYYTGNQGEEAQFNLWKFDFKTGKSTQLTTFPDNPVILPGISGDGSHLIFRTGFEFWRMDLNKGTRVRKVPFWAADDGLKDSTVRRTLTKATNLSFSGDGLEVAFASGGDIWVMDSILKEPRQVTRTPFEEREPVFAPDGKSIHFIREKIDKIDIWQAVRSNEKTYFWQNKVFVEKQVSRDGLQKLDLQFVPGGKRISYVRGQGELVSSEPEGGNLKSHLKSWNTPSYDWSPDGKWITYSVSDNNFNRDVWIKPVDNHREPYNLSRHPDNDTSPRWSPDGKLIAFTGRRFEKETDIYYAYLSPEPEEETKRDKALKSALEKMKKERKTPPVPKPKEPAKPATPAPVKEPVSPSTPKPATSKGTEQAKPKPGPDTPAKPSKPATPKVAVAKKPMPKPTGPQIKIDFDRLYERLRRVSIKNSAESSLFWAHDSKRLAFRGEVKSVKGTFYVSIPDKLTPTLLNAKMGALARWDAKNDTIYWLVDGLPASLTKGALKTYSFKARQEYDKQEYQRAAFHQIWRVMRDNWYDSNMNDRNWNAVRTKYEKAATGAGSTTAFDRVISMMLGELNGSHTGFRSRATISRTSQGSWSDETAHPGVQFDRFHEGPGLKINFVIPGSQADETGVDLEAGDVIVKIDGVSVTRNTDLTTVLNGVREREIELELLPREKDKNGNRKIMLRPIPYSEARNHLKADRLAKNREMVEKLSKGKLGYLYVPRMQWNEFIKFEEEVYARGAGKDGLVIDVRDNGGGFTADHLLTVLNPIRHAYTIARGGEVGYPQDRLVYAAWDKPIIVLCNQNSFSNAEIFSHAIKNLGRGKLVGVASAGGVISTGSKTIMDVGVLRIPHRGWYSRSTGLDMEMNPAEPQIVIWPHPADSAKGKDRQITAAVTELLKEVKEQQGKPKPKLIPRSQE